MMFRSAITLVAISTVAFADNILVEEYGMKRVARGCEFTEGPAVGHDGTLYFSDNFSNCVAKR